MDLKRYTKLFNQGYMLAKHEPGVLDKLIKLSKNVDAIKEPLMAGELQYKKELAQAKVQENIQAKTIERKKGKDLDLEM